MAKKANNIQQAVQGFSEEEAKRLLQQEGRRLKYIAVKLWRKYLASYQPTQYVRTRKSQRGIKLGKVKQISPNQWGIELTWENSLMYHDSIFKNNPKGHSVMLISDGWHSRKLEARIGRVDRLTYFEGTGYLYKVYKEWNRSAPKGITLETQWSGQYYK